MRTGSKRISKRGFRATNKPRWPRKIEYSEYPTGRLSIYRSFNSAARVFFWPSIIPIPGTRRMGRLHENIATAEVELSAADLSQI
jgi:hypothetical protein